MTPEKQRAYEIKRLTNDTLQTALKVFGSFFSGAGLLASIVLLMQTVSLAQAGSKATPSFLMFLATALFAAVIFCLCFGVAKVLEQNSFIINEKIKGEISEQPQKN